MTCHDISLRLTFFTHKVSMEIFAELNSVSVILRSMKNLVQGVSFNTSKISQNLSKKDQ